VQLSLPGKPGYQPNQSINTVIMTTNAEIREFLEEICEVPVTIEDNFSIFKHADDASKPCELICTETLDWVPNQVIETFVVKANPFKVSFEGSLVLDSF
jgi:hypothetical protein